jgi:uncharacterized protein YjbI with pentapeptide repeats
MLRLILATSSSSEETFSEELTLSADLAPFEDEAILAPQLNEDSFEVVQTEIRSPLETAADKEAIAGAWAGENNQESVNLYIDSQNAKPETIKLAGKPLAGINLDNKRLSLAQFQWCNLTAATFRKADLGQTKFHAATLSNADFTKATSLFVDLSGTVAIGAIFNGAELEVSCFDLAYMQGAQFVKTNLRGMCAFDTNFYQANFKDAILVEADLEGADLSYSNLKNANLKRAQLLKTNLRDATLDGTQLKGSIFFPSCDELDAGNLREYLDCYAEFYINPITDKVNKSLYKLREYMCQDLINKINTKYYRVGLAGVEDLLKIAFDHPVFSVHKKHSTYRLNHFFSKNADDNAIFTTSQRTIAACHKRIIKHNARYGRP